MEIAAMGSEDFLLGFRLVGVRKAVVVDDDEVQQKLASLMGDDGVGIIIVHNTTLARLTEEQKRDALDSVSPVVVSVGTDEDDDLREKVKRAIGIDLYKGG